MKGPCEACKRRVWNAIQSRKFRMLRRDVIQAVIPERTWRSLRLFSQPVMMKRNVGEITSNGTEGMHVRMTLLVPVDEFDAELERSLCLSQEVVFIDAQHLVELRDRWNCRLTDSDDADLGGLDQRY